MEEKNNNEIKHIQELPKHVADKIAAGEVVDRPLSIVKELLENAIDAGSTSIVVEIKNGGKSYIRVTDNGCGIMKQDIDLAFKRHATSKIKAADDLEHLDSLGFRGEALASISAVSRIELVTKTAEDKSGIRVKLEGGTVLEKEDTGCPDGTTLVIEDLFFNTPARQKFMKADATESTVIIDFVSKMTLAYPAIKIRLINNGNILFSTPGKGDLYSNILTIYSKEIGEKLIPVTGQQGDITLSAYVSPPNQSKTNRKSQIFFVNGRYIGSKLLEAAVTDAYHEKLFDGRYPITFLFLQIASDQLDVNIHPNKKEVRFSDEKMVREFVARVIRSGLQTKEAIPEIKESNIFKRKDFVGTAENLVKSTDTNMSRGNQQGFLQGKLVKREEQVDIKKLLSEKRKEKQAEQTNRVFSQEIPNQKVQVGQAKPPSFEKRIEEKKPAVLEPSLEIIAESQSEYFSKIQENPYTETQTKAKVVLEDDMQGVQRGKHFDISELHVMGALFGTYLVASDEESFYLVDQHAAHERVFYEQLLAEYEREDKDQQLILTPFVVNVTQAMKNQMEGMSEFVSNLGFAVEEFGPTSYIIKEIPIYMDLEEAKEFIEYLFDNISDQEDLKNQRKINKIITNACKKSVKAHDVLDQKEIHQLMADLAKTKNPYSCPHGRPTFIRMSKYEIEKMFKRV